MKFLVFLLLSFILLFSASKAHGESLHLYLSSEINTKSVAFLKDQISQANKDKTETIFLEINSNGGDIDEGFHLTKIIETSKIPIVCIVDGEADSMASYVLMSCKNRIMTKRSRLMFHEAGLTAKVVGQPNDWMNVAMELEFMTKAMAEQYCLHMKVSVADFLKNIAGGKEWWIGWEEAQRLQAVDKIVNSVSDIFIEK